MLSVNPAMPSLHVDFLWLPETMLGTLWAGIDVLQTAQMIAQMQQSTLETNLSWQVIRLETAPQFKLQSVQEFSSKKVKPVQSTDTTHILMLPGLYTKNAVSLWSLMDKYALVFEYITQHRANQGIVAATFTGLVIPARLGLLNGQKVSVHWAYKSGFVSRVPQADFSGQEAISLLPPVYHCVAPSDQMEFMVSILGSHLSDDLAQACRSVLFFQSKRQEITDDMVKQKWLSRTADSPIYRAVQWMDAHLAEPYSLSKLAGIARVSERTLLRQFKSVLGLTPLQYLQQQRIERAKLMFEVTIDTVQTVATACGYADVGSLRRLFLRATGVPPGVYRKRFALRTQRSRWRVGDD